MKTNKKGFTLVELLGVIVIIAVLSLVAFPGIMNQFRKSKGDISQATETIMKEAANVYLLDHPNEYPKVNGKYYCISVEQLINDGRLSEPFTDPTTGNEIPKDYKIKAIVENGQYEYTVITDGSCTK